MASPHAEGERSDDIPVFYAVDMHDKRSMVSHNCERVSEIVCFE